MPCAKDLRDMLVATKNMSRSPVESIEREKEKLKSVPVRPSVPRKEEAPAT